MIGSERSPLYAYLKQPSMVDFPGRMAVTFFVSGCNFRCGFCHNAALMGAAREGLSWDDLRKACDRFSAEWVQAAVVSGGEPTLHPEVGAVLDYFQQIGWAIKLDTNGSHPQQLAAWLPQLAYVAMDIKAGPDTYHDLTGYPDVDTLRVSIDLIKRQAADYEFRTTVIEPFHTDEQMHAAGRMIQGAKRWVLQPFLPKDGLPDPALRTVSRTTPARLKALQAMLRPYANEVLLRGA